MKSARAKVYKAVGREVENDAKTSIASPQAMMQERHNASRCESKQVRLTPLTHVEIAVMPSIGISRQEIPPADLA